MFDTVSRKLLLNLARASIEREFAQDKPEPLPTDLPDELQQALACFVTLHIDQTLRGCIGNLEADSLLVNAVMNNARSAAFRDPRFAPLNQAELQTVCISISVLNQPQVLRFSNEPDLLSKIRPGIDGLTIKKGLRQATFLPAVWESLSEPETFLKYLKDKAGFETYDSPDQAWVYQTESFSEDG